MSDSTPADAVYDELLRLLNARTGLSFRRDQRDSVRQAVECTMQRTGFTDLQSYAGALARDDRALDDLISELTVGETYFFREPSHFQFIRDTILPDLLRRFGEKHLIRAWSAGCASGEEPYSLAIFFDRQGLASRSNVLGTDISRKLLTRAREATYQTWSLRGPGAKLAEPYLNRDGQSFRLDVRVRSRVRFEYLNLALDVYPSIVTGTWGLDLILCRNVLIYLDRDTVRAVARRLYDSLAVGGWLITSSADPPLDQFALFEPVMTDCGTFYRRAPSATPRYTLAPSNRRDASEPPPAERVITAASGKLSGASIAAQDATAGRPAAQPYGNSQAPTPAAGGSPCDPQELARCALAQGEYQRAAELIGDRPVKADAWAIRIQALANLDTAVALTACDAAVAQHPLSAELHYLHVVLFMEANQHESAAEAAQRIIFLDRSLAIGHFLLGSTLRRVGDLSGARRSFRNARDLCSRRPADELVPLTDGEVAGRLTEAANLQLAGLDIMDGCV